MNIIKIFVSLKKKQMQNCQVGEYFSAVAVCGIVWDVMILLHV